MNLVQSGHPPTPWLLPYGKIYRETLTEKIVPFWMRFSCDKQFGGIGNILDDAGKVLGHRKFLWSQGRALWTFSALYTHVEKRPEWLEFASHIYHYISTHGRDKNGKWMFLLDENGTVLEKDTSIFVDGFVMNGLAEYYQASDEKDALNLAMETYRNISQRLHNPGSYNIAPYQLPQGLKAHGVAMIYSFFFNHLGIISNNATIKNHGFQLAHEILDQFYNPQRHLVLEFVGLQGNFVDTPQGRTCVPGHVIEAMWFLLSIFERENDQKNIDTCCQLIKRHLELAWDEQYGGLTLGFDVDGKSPIYWEKSDCKPWWVQIEALVATAYASRFTNESWCQEWHDRIHQFAFEYYPTPSGEWTQWLSNDRQRMASAALPVKDPFHLPRGLMYLMALSGALAG